MIQDDADVSSQGISSVTPRVKPPTIQVNVTFDNGTSSMVAVKPGTTVDVDTSYISTEPQSGILKSNITNP